MSCCISSKKEYSLWNGISGTGDKKLQGFVLQHLRCTMVQDFPKYFLTSGLSTLRQDRSCNRHFPYFGVTITYPPTDEEKDDIKRINTEDIFPDDIAAPSLEEGEECKHGNKFSAKLEAINIESRNMIIHHSQDTKDSRSGSLVIYALCTDGNVCDCKKHFTGSIVGSTSIVLHLILLLLSLKHILQVRTRSC